MIINKEFVFITVCSLQVDSASLTASITLARGFLEDQLSSVASDPYALSIIAYALTLAQSPRANDVLQMLEALAKVEGINVRRTTSKVFLIL